MATCQLSKIFFFSDREYQIHVKDAHTDTGISIMDVNWEHLHFEEINIHFVISARLYKR